MNRTAIFPTAIAAILVLVLIGFAIAHTSEQKPSSVTIPSPSTSATSAKTASAAYKNGSYTADGTYTTPEGPNTGKVDVKLTVAGGEVNAVTVTPEASGPESQHYESLFAAGISSVVVGKPLGANFDVSEVNGSSLTGSGFTTALNSIRSQAKA
jgi:uncharacterized protein with FMN-binding domain